MKYAAISSLGIDFASLKGTGFILLVEAGLGTCPVGYIVATNPNRFPADAVATARTWLAEHGVPLPN